MRIFCFERDNLTQLSDADSEGCQYTASFELFPFHEGATYAFYKGIINGDGPLRGSFCVIRALLDKVSEAQDWTPVLRRAAEAQILAKEFNKQLGYAAVTFQVPVLTQMETVSDFTGLFRCWKPHDKHLKVDEFVTMELLLKGKLQNFDAPIGYAPAYRKLHPKTDNAEEVNADDNDVLSDTSSFILPVMPVYSSNLAQAFSHFTWHKTRSLVVCGLQGVSNNGVTYTLTNPTIHSIDCRYGDSDGSSKAIAEFFSSHRCNNICCNWAPYTSPSDINTKRQVNYFAEPELPSPYFQHNPAEPSGQLLLRKENNFIQPQVQATLL